MLTPPDDEAEPLRVGIKRIAGHDVVKYALIPGRIEPGSKLRGFVYFQPIPEGINRFIFKLTYWIEGRPVSVKFPFKIEKDGKGSSDNGSEEDRAEDSL